MRLPQLLRSGTGIADPAPLGLAAFALTTFLLSAVNAGSPKSTTSAPTGSATPSPTVASSSCWPACGSSATGTSSAPRRSRRYGGFWIGLGLWATLVAPHATSRRGGKDLGWILLAFAIFNTYMLLFSTQLNVAVFLVFLTLELTEIFLFIGNFAGNSRHRQGRRRRRHRDRARRLVHLGGWA